MCGYDQFCPEGLRCGDKCEVGCQCILSKRSCEFYCHDCTRRAGTTAYCGECSEGNAGRSRMVETPSCCRECEVHSMVSGKYQCKYCNKGSGANV